MFIKFYNEIINDKNTNNVIYKYASKMVKVQSEIGIDWSSYINGESGRVNSYTMSGISITLLNTPIPDMSRG